MAKSAHVPPSAGSTATASTLPLNLLFGERRTSLALLAAQWCRVLDAEACAVFLPTEEKSQSPTAAETLRIEASFPPDIADAWTAFTPPSVQDFRSGWVGEVAFNRAVVRLGPKELATAQMGWRPPSSPLPRSVLALPVFGRNQNLIAVLEFVNKQSSAEQASFTAEDEAKGRTVAETAALFLVTHRCRDLFLSFLPHLLGDAGLSEMYAVVLRLAVDLLEADRGDLVVFDSEKGDLVHQLSIPDRPVDHPITPTPERCVVREVWDSGCPCRIEDIRNTDKPYYPLDPATSSDLAVRWDVAGQPRGVLNLESRTPSHFTRRDEALLTLIGQAVPYFCQLFGQLISFTSFDQVSWSLTMDTNQQADTPQMVLESVCHAHGFEAGRIYLLTPDGKRLTCRASFGCAGVGFSYALEDELPSLTTAIFRGKKGRFVEFPRQSRDVDRKAVEQLGITGSLVGVPLLQRDRPFGVLIVWNNTNPRHARPEHVDLLTPIARMAAATITLAETARLPVEAVIAHREIQREIHKNSALEDNLSRIIDKLVETSGFERVRLYLYSESTHSFECLTWRNMGADFKGHVIPVEPGRYSYDIFNAGDSNAAVQVYYPQYDPRGVDPDARALGKQEHLPWAVLPLRINGQVCGQIAADNALTQKIITQRSLDILTILGGLGNQAIASDHVLTGNRLTAALGVLFEALQQQDARPVVIRRLLVAATHKDGLGFCHAVFLDRQKRARKQSSPIGAEGRDDRLEFAAAEGCANEAEHSAKAAEDPCPSLKASIAAVKETTSSLLDRSFRGFAVDPNDPHVAELFQVPEAKLYCEANRDGWRPPWVQEMATRLGAKELLVMAVSSDGKPSGLIAVDRSFQKRPLSVTERLALAQFAQRVVALILRQHTLYQEVREATELATMGAVVRSITHEIRHHLTSLMYDPGNLLNDLRQRKHEAAVRCAERINAAAIAIVDVVGNMELLRNPVEGLKVTPVQSILEHAVRHCSARAAQLGVGLGITPDVPKDAFPLIAGLLTTGLENLISNALDAFERSPADGVEPRRVELSTRREGGWLVLGVNDNGPGIPAEDLAKVRQRGFTFTSRPGKGMGFGVEIARRAAEAHVVGTQKGYLEVDSEPGNRTDFWLVLPVEPERR